MAEIVTSAVAGETVNRIISSIIGRDDDKSTENMERLEMAHIKMESVLHVTDKWQITDVPLLRWRSKLKRAAQECGDALQRCKQRVIEEQEIRQQVSQLSYPKRIAYCTKSFMSSITRSSNDESRSSSTDVVQRFERYADGTPRQYMSLSLLSSVEPHGSTCSSTISSANFLEGSLLGTKHSKEADFTT
jgi:hypothetical protein